MKKIIFSCLSILFSLQAASVNAHCQMPCGIYHDDMVFDQIDQYIETMAKGVSVLNENKFADIQDRNTFIRWVMEKEEASDDVARVFLQYFLQQKIKAGEEDTTKRVLSVHKLLLLLTTIKQTVDLKCINDFYEEWENFKLMFHIEGYSCKLEQIKLKKWAEQQKRMKESGVSDSSVMNTDDKKHNHSHDHDHDHSHGEADHKH